MVSNYGGGFLVRCSIIDHAELKGKGTVFLLFTLVCIPSH